MLDTSDQIMEADYNSSKTISWKALREAEEVENVNFIPQLISFIDHEKDKKKRDKAYFLLGHIVKNTNNSIALNYLIQRVGKEKDKYIVASLLNIISDIKKPIGTELQPLFDAIKSDKWLVRHNAIRSLNNSFDPLSEAILIEILEKSDDSYNLTYSNATLNTIGTLRAIPYLEKHLKSKKRDVQNSARFAVEEIMKRNGQEMLNL